MLTGVAPDQIFKIVFEQRFETEENPGPFGRGRFRPGRESDCGCFDRLVYMAGSAHRCLRDDFTGRRVMNGGSGDTVEFVPLPAERNGHKLESMCVTCGYRLHKC